MARGLDWMRQAERYIEHAKMAKEKGFYEWACFSAQQAAEKALKALYFYNNEEAWGHSLLNLIKGLKGVPSDLEKKAAKLDRFYIPTRYANSFELGAPSDYFFKEDAEEAIEYAEEIIRFCKNLLGR